MADDFPLYGRTCNNKLIAMHGAPQKTPEADHPGS